MIRESYADIYNDEVRGIVQELLNACLNTMVHLGDLLVCQQNGFIGLGAPCLGMGKTGGDYYKQLNQIVFQGLGTITKDNDCFVKSRSIFFDGTTEFERGVEDEMHKYLLIWENGYFLKTLKEISLLLNGKHYDWELDIDNKPPNTRSGYIIDSVISKFSKVPRFQELLNKAYNKDLRNAISHSQCNLVQGGIVLINKGKNEKNPFYGLTFEQWEEIYSKSWFVLRYIFGGLKNVMENIYIPMTKEIPTGGIPILIPNGKQKWYQTYVYYFENGNRWSFHK